MASHETSMVLLAGSAFKRIPCIVCGSPAAVANAAGTSRANARNARPIIISLSLSAISFAVSVGLLCRRGCRDRLVVAQLEWVPFELGVGGGKFLDLDILVLYDPCKVLSRARSRPPDVQRDVVRVGAQPDMLLHRIASEGTGLPNRPEDGPWRGVSVLHRDMNLRPHAGAIGLDAHQSHIDPVVLVAWIIEDPDVVLVRRDRSADPGQNVLTALAGQVGKNDRVSLVQFSCSRRLGDIYKRFAIFVAEQHIR